MNWQAGILGAFAAMFFFCLVVLIVHEVRKGPKLNRRRGLPPPSDACKRRGPECVP